MADTVSTQTLTDTTGVKFAVKMTNISDGTGENLVTKVDASNTTFMTEDGERKISKIFWSVNTQSGKSACLLYTSPSPRDKRQSRMPSSA